MADIDKIKTQLSENLKFLKRKKITQKQIPALLHGISNGKITLQPSRISEAKKSKNFLVITKIVDYTQIIIDFIEKNPYSFEEKINQIIEGDPKFELKAWSTIVDLFVTTEVDLWNNNKIKQTTNTIKIEAIGMKLNSLLKSLQSIYSKKALPICELKCLLIDPDGVGKEFRDIIEGNRREYATSITTGFLNWYQFRDDIKNDNHRALKDIFNFRLLKPDPNIYMIKIGDKMLVSPYLRDVGNTTHYEIFNFNKPKQSKSFQDFYNLYLKYFTTEELSSDLSWDHEIFKS